MMGVTNWLEFKIELSANGGFGFPLIQIFHILNHALKSCFMGWYLFRDKSLYTIYMQWLIICPPVIVDFS